MSNGCLSAFSGCLLVGGWVREWVNGSAERLCHGVVDVDVSSGLDVSVGELSMHLETQNHMLGPTD